MDELPQVTETESIIKTDFDIEYDKSVLAIPDNVRLVIEKLGWKLKHDGLSLDEACLLCNVDMQWLEKRIFEHPVIRTAFAKKELEYRTALMAPLHKRAKNDDKMAMFLLELKYPKQKGKTDPNDDSGDMLAAAVSFVQESGDSTPLVTRTNNTAFVVGKGGGAKRLMEQIGRLLPKNSLA